MVKIIEEQKPARTGMAYLEAVERSIRHLNNYHEAKGRALTEGDLIHECKQQYGTAWTYDPILDACVDERFNNSSLRREGSEITVNVNTHTWPDQYSFRGTWGTPITSDDKLHTNRDSSGNARTVIGVDPAAKFPYGKTAEKKTFHIRVYLPMQLLRGHLR